MGMRAGLLVFLMLWAGAIFGQVVVSGDATLQAKIGTDEIAITTTSRLAGAIHSLRFRGMEYIDSFDHGRQLQSASNLNCGKKFIPEVFNPTEAGSEADGRGPVSSSKLLELRVADGEIRTLSQMAFWIRPGEKTQGNPAYNTTILSNHFLRKQVRIGYEDLPRVLDYRVTFTLPGDEKHSYAQFEALTGYMPGSFQRFLRWDPEMKKLVPLEKKMGEQPFPVVLATEDGRHAMGVYSPARFQVACRGPGYGRFDFPTDKVVKWNCVFRLEDRKGVPPGDYSFRMVVPFGTVSEVEGTLRILHDRLEK